MISMFFTVNILHTIFARYLAFVAAREYFVIMNARSNSCSLLYSFVQVFYARSLIFMVLVQGHFA